MEENKTVETGNTEKTFTQAELDAIVGERLSRERAKYSDYEELKGKAAKYDEAEEAQKTELQKATKKATSLEAELTALKKAEEIRGIREKVSKETGVPINLITAETEEACSEQAKAIAEFATPSGYPKVKDGGEPSKYSKPSTRDIFSQWASKVL